MAQKRILCIEDDTFLRDLISGKLIHAGVWAIGAHNGAEGIAAAKSESPDLILLDLMLPDMHGMEVLKAIKGDPATREIPVVIFSNLGDKDEIARELALGAHSYLVKSSTLPGELIEIVAKDLGIVLPAPPEDRSGGFSVIGIVFALALLALFTLMFITIRDAQKKEAETPRIEIDLETPLLTAKMASLKLGMELYRFEKGEYPPVPGECVSISRAEKYLVPTYVNELPEGRFSVSVSEDKKQFVLRTKVKPDSDVLLGSGPNQDQDGEILGCGCDDPYYCLIELESAPGANGSSDAPVEPGGGVPRTEEFGDDANPILPALPGSPAFPPVACTMDAKICPDGSAVGRTGPNCEFAPCP